MSTRGTPAAPGRPPFSRSPRPRPRRPGAGRFFDDGEGTLAGCADRLLLREEARVAPRRESSGDRRRELLDDVRERASGARAAEVPDEGESASTPKRIPRRQTKNWCPKVWRGDSASPYVSFRIVLPDADPRALRRARVRAVSRWYDGDGTTTRARAATLDARRGTPVPPRYEVRSTRSARVSAHAPEPRITQTDTTHDEVDVFERAHHEDDDGGDETRTPEA